MYDEIDRFITNPTLMEIVIPAMLKKLKDPRQQFIFTFCILDGHPQKLAAEILRVHETSVSRQIRRIRTKLVSHATGYDVGAKYVKNGTK